ncbi:MAG: exonuclease SbcCD subunit D [Anaerofustis sp.]
MKFIHASDFHLCSCFRTSSLPAQTAAEHRDQLWRTFGSIIETCRVQQVDLLLISGDLYEHEYAKISDVKRIADAFESIPKTKIFISCGNHDPLYEQSYYRILQFPNNVFIFPPEMTSFEIPELNCIIHGFSWNRSRYENVPFEWPKTDPGKTNILMLHCDVLNQSFYLPTDPSVLAKLPFQYIALGHIHKSMQVKNHIFYSGSPEPLDFGEEGKHGYFIGELTKERLTVKFIRSAKRSFLSIRLPLNGSMNNNDIKDAVRNACADCPEQNIYRVSFEGSLSPLVDLPELMKELQSEYYCLLWEDHSSADYDLSALYEQNQNNLIGKYIELLSSQTSDDPIAEKAIRYGLSALLEQNGGRA